MKYEVVGKNGLVVTEAMKVYAIEKLGKVEQYFTEHEHIECRVVFKIYPEGQKVEVTIPVKHMILRSEVVEADIYAAIDRAVDKLEGQIRKQKTRTNKILQQREGISSFFNDDLDTKGISTRLEAQKLVKTKNVELTPMSSEEAINQMEMLGHPFYIFKDSFTGKTNVVYIRDDFDYGVIETDY